MKAQERGRDADLQRSAAVRCQRHVPNVILALASFDCVFLIFDWSKAACSKGMSVHAVAHVVAMLVMLAVVHDAGVRSR